MRRQLLRKIVTAAVCAWLAIGVSGPAVALPDYHNPANPANSGFYPWPPLTLPDGRILFFGGYALPPGNYSFAVARFNSDGTPDVSLNGNGFVQAPIWGYYEFVNAIAVQPDGKIIAGGNAADPIRRADDQCHPAFCNDYPALIRLNADGTLDRSFNGTGKLVISIGDANLGEDCCGSLDSLELQPDGRILVRSGGTAVARVNADGTLDRSFVGPAQEISPDGNMPAIGAGITGTWFNPAQTGHGFALQVLPGTPMQLLASWFTFAPQGGPSWIVGLGRVDGNRAVLQASQPAGSGARFPPNFDPANVHDENWGTLTFTFSDCDHGHVDWASTAPGYGSGGIDIARLTLPAGLTCPQ